MRERHALRAKKAARKGLPKNIARKAAIPTLVVVILAGVAYGFYHEATTPQTCPGHFHATFGIYIPGPDGAPQWVDFASPRASDGQAYYQLNEAPGMTLSHHMHQSGAEQGAADLGPTQLHFEPPVVDTCVPLRDVLSGLDAKVSSTSLTLSGAHSQTGQSGTWKANATGAIHTYYRSMTGNWTEVHISSWLGKQLPDGSSIIIAYGTYSADQIQHIEDQIPFPISNPRRGQ